MAFKISRHISSIIKLVIASFHQSVSNKWKHRIEDGLNFDHLEQPVSEEKPVVPGQTAPQAEVASVSCFGNGPTQADYSVVMGHFVESKVGTSRW